MTRVACIFGGRSVEHEVSVITAHQAMAALGPAHTAMPVYIAKDGRWFTGSALSRLDAFRDVGALVRECRQVTPEIDPVRGGLRLRAVEVARRGLLGRAEGDGVIEADVVMPLLHGPLGEDGTLQGLLEIAGVPYTGSGTSASAVAMDKRLTKTVLRGAGLPVLPDVAVSRQEWERAPSEAADRAETLGPYPLYVKPVSLGSSIGVSRAAGREQLGEGVALALTYDVCCLVEPAQQDVVEVNCAVLGDDSGSRASAIEQPVVKGPLLSYDDKYRGGGKSSSAGGMKSLRRLVPAPLEAPVAAAVTGAAQRAFHAVAASGVARVDLMVNPASGALLVNEINPIPGSLSFYLFEPVGLSFPQLLDELIELAQRRHRARAATTMAFDRWMLSPAGGAAAAKAG